MNQLSDVLRDVLPPKARKYVYAWVALAAFIWGAFQASHGDWGQFVGGLLVSLTGATAASNTPAPMDAPAAPPHVVPAEPLDAPNEDYEPRHADE